MQAGLSSSGCKEAPTQLQLFISVQICTRTSQKGYEMTIETVGRGGNVNFMPGKGNPNGCISMKLPDGTEMLRIDDHGFHVRGELLPKDPMEAALVYVAFRSWLMSALVTIEDSISVSVEPFAR